MSRIIYQANWATEPYMNNKNIQLDIETKSELKAVGTDYTTAQKMKERFFKGLRAGTGENYKRFHFDMLESIMCDSELDKSAIYLLFKVPADKDKDVELPQIYVGQAGGQLLFKRLEQHTHSDDPLCKKWNKGFLFTKESLDEDNVNNIGRYEQLIYDLIGTYVDEGRINLENLNGCNSSLKHKKSIQAYGLNDSDKSLLINIITLLKANNINLLNPILDDLNSENAKYTGEVKYNETDIIDNEKLPEYETPKNIVSDMMKMVFDQLDADLAEKYKDMTEQEREQKINDEIAKLRFLDISVKERCEFLECIYDILMSRLEKVIPNKMIRQQHIINDQLFGLTLSAKVANKVGKQLGHHYIYAVTDGEKYIRRVKNITKMRNYKEKVQNTSAHISSVFNSIFDTNGEFDSMTFDIVVGNPPYNRDDYLDFVRFGNKIAKRYTCMITPAKWQGKGGERNEAFRKEIVPYMSKIVYYPEATDIFDIQECDGLTTYLINSIKQDRTYVVNKSDDIVAFNDAESYKTNVISNVSLLNKANSIIQKIGSLQKINTSTNKKDEYFVAESERYGWGTERKKENITYKSCKCYTNELKYNVISEPQVVHKNDLPYLAKVRAITFSSNSKAECESYRSFMESKFVKFLMLSARVGTMTGEQAKRFVPDPGAFDHIFTDEELYKKYNLTQDEIDLIESVIKDRTR